jgi:hypothetical protein
VQTASAEQRATRTDRDANRPLEGGQAPDQAFNWIAYHLVCAGWRVYAPLSGVGHGQLVEQYGKRCWIEVKSRDLGHRSGKNLRYIAVDQTHQQRTAADILAVCQHGAGAGLLIPCALLAISERRVRNAVKIGE